MDENEALRKPPPLALFVQRWPSADLQREAFLASRALKKRGLADAAVCAALEEATQLIASKWPQYARDAEAPDLVVFDDEPEPYVALRLPIPATPEEAAELTWLLNGRMIERHLDPRGLSIAYSPSYFEPTPARHERLAY
jgi:hypothetical protein